MRAARVMLVALAVAACGGGAPLTTPAPATPPPATTTLHQITAQVTLHDSERENLIADTGNKTCAGAGGYSDIGPGMQATIKDAAGTILGVANFSAGSVTNIIGRSVTECQFSATIASVPDTAFYAVDLGRRGSVQFTKADLESANWIAAITIGK